ncbi:VOC family protein [Pseudonocardia spinosispora]|uniref:VOC family protein n=1 Tax=Pseudonocardia spinosispora TaxID=103441 RepID=UPI000491FE53|nr:VOC family protein [Pseudonocardia spinosispora]
MTLSLGMVTFDCADPQKLSAFWASALGTSVAGDYGDFVFLAPTDGGQINFGFQRVSDPTPGKNRVHMDLGGGTGRVAEVGRLVELGATVVHEQVGVVPGIDWTTLEDPEGNQFCVADHHDV